MVKRVLLFLPICCCVALCLIGACAEVVACDLMRVAGWKESWWKPYRTTLPE